MKLPPHSLAKTMGWLPTASVGLTLLLPAALGQGPSPAANSGLTDEIPPLRPPAGEMPPDFWEQHGPAVIIAALLLTITAALLLRKWMQPRPVPLPDPYETALKSLAEARDQSEESMALLIVTRAVRTYFSEILKLPAAERTTTEMDAAIAERLDNTELRQELHRFLQACDVARFSLAPSDARIHREEALKVAAALLAQGEVYRKASTEPASSKDAAAVSAPA